MIRFSEKFKKGKLGMFPKLMLMLASVSILPIVIVSSSIFIITERNMEEEISRSNMDMLKQTKVSVDNILESTERISQQLVRNKEVQKFWNTRLDGNADNKTFFINETVANTINAAESLLEGVIYIDQISIYSLYNNVMVTSGSRTYRKLGNSFLSNYQQSINANGFNIWIEPGDTDIFGQKSDSIQLVSFIYETFNKPQGFVLIKLRSNEFMKLINSIHIRKSGFISLISKNGSVILSKSDRTEDKNVLKQISGKIHAADGYEKITYSGVTYLCSYVTSIYNNWSYVVVLPTDELEFKKKEIGNFTLLICLIFILINTVISYAISRDIYNPILLIESLVKGERPQEKKLEKLWSRNDEFGRINRGIDSFLSQLSEEKEIKDSVEKENYSLKKRLEDNVSQMKEYFLYKLMYGDITDMEKIREQALFLGIPEAGNFLVMLVEFDRSFDTIVKDLDENQQASIKDGILNIFEKAIANVTGLVKIFYERNEGEERIVALLTLAGSTFEEAAEGIPAVKQMCDFIKNAIYSNFSFTVTISLGKSCSGLGNIQNSYDEANKALKYKFVLGTNTVIVKNEIEESPGMGMSQYSYKNHIKNCLKAKNIKEISKVLINFKEQAVRGKVASNPLYVYFCKDLINILIEHLNETNYPYSEDKKLLNEAFLNFEQKFENMDEAVRWFTEFVVRVFEQQYNAPNELNKLVEKALKIIDMEYFTDLSLSYICEKLGVSEPYFSALFKEQLGKNFKEYLISYKLSKAKEMLKNSELPVYEISTRVGYNNYNQFTRIFKKYEGISPAEFRSFGQVE